MASIVEMLCDGCGQMASPEHTARRLRRLEWATRYRPVHIRALLVGAVTPVKDSEFLYCSSVEFHEEERSTRESGLYNQSLGEAAFLLQTVGISPAGKAAEAVQAEFQADGFFLVHVLECPVETRPSAIADLTDVLRERLPFLAARIRRSLKPKRVILVTEALEPLVQNILALDLSCPVILHDARSKPLLQL